MKSEILTHKIMIFWIIVLVSVVLVVFSFGVWILLNLQNNEAEATVIKQHSVKLSIPAEIVGNNYSGGYASFDDQILTNVSPGDRLIIFIEFPDKLEVKGDPSSVSLSINGESVTSKSVLGVDPLIENEGTLKLRWSNGGIRGQTPTGEIQGFWINLVAANTPQDGQILNSLEASFTVPETMLSYPLQKNQDIKILTVRWINLSSPD